MSDRSEERTPQDVLRESILAVPMGTFPKVGLASVAGWNRYDTDNEHVLHLWSSDQSHQGKSWDFRAPKAIAEASDSPLEPAPAERQPQTDAGKAMLQAWAQRSWSRFALRLAILDIEDETAAAVTGHRSRIKRRP